MFVPKFKWKPVEPPEVQQPDQWQESGPPIMTLVKAATSPLVQAFGNGDYGEFRYFNLETNFNITDEMIMDGQAVEGVETIRGISRYRCLVAIATLFEVQEVQESFDYFLISRIKTEFPKHLPIKVSNEMDETTELYARAFINETFAPFFSLWATLINPDTKEVVDYVGSMAEDEIFNGQIRLLEAKKDKFGGVILRNSL